MNCICHGNNGADEQSEYVVELLLLILFSEEVGYDHMCTKVGHASQYKTFINSKKHDEVDYFKRRCTKMKQKLTYCRRGFLSACAYCENGKKLCA